MCRDMPSVCKLPMAVGCWGYNTGILDLLNFLVHTNQVEADKTRAQFVVEISFGSVSSFVKC